MGKLVRLSSLIIALLVLAAACAPAAAPPPPTPTKAPPTAAAPAAAPTQQPAAPAATATPAPKPAAQLKKVTVSYCAPTAAQALSWITADAGLFAKYGLDATVEYVATVNQVASVVAGRIQGATCDANSIMAATLEGGNLQILALVLPYMQSELWAQPEIKTAQDLKGKTVGGLGEAPNIMTYSAQYGLRKLGLDPKTDVRWRHFANPADVTSAFLSGQLDAAPLFPPDTLKARKAGKTMIYDMRKDREYFPSLSLYSRKDLDKEVRDGFLKAMLEGIKVYKTDRTFSVNTIMKWAKIEDREVAEESYRYFSEAIPRVPKTDEAALKVSLSVLAATRPDAATADPKRFYDNSYVEDLEKAGFFKQLWGE